MGVDTVLDAGGDIGDGRGERKEQNGIRGEGA